LAAQGERHRRTLMRVLAANQILILVMDAAVTLGVVLTGALLAADRVGDGALTAGQGLAVILCALLVISPIDLVGQFFYIGIGGRAAQRAISAHLHRRREPDAKPDEAAPGTGAPRIVRRSEEHPTEL